jgi:NAD(P)-dependent dehydrogenase (short-subunit alcohol dehydrogenase family)
VGRLAGKVAVVTGAGSGIGRAVAQAFGSEEARVGLLDINLAAYGSAAEDLRGGGLLLPADVGSEEEVAKAFECVGEQFGGLDILVNCAAIMPKSLDTTVHQLDLEAWQAVMRVNLTGVFLCCKHALRLMLRGHRGSIINIGSPTAVTGRGWRYAAYSASKGGVHALTKGLAVAYGRNGIRANLIVPGTIRTAMTQEILAEPDRSADLTERTPLGRLGVPDDLIGMAVFLASDDSAYATGATFVVDGGLMVS